MQRHVMVISRGRDVPLHDRPGRLHSEGDEGERRSALMQAFTRYRGSPAGIPGTLGSLGTRSSRGSTSYSVPHLERGAPGGIDGVAPDGGAGPSFGGASDWDRAFSGSTTISGSILGGGMDRCGAWHGFRNLLDTRIDAARGESEPGSSEASVLRGDPALVA